MIFSKTFGLQDKILHPGNQKENQNERHDNTFKITV